MRRKPNENQSKLEFLRRQRSISREIQLESGIRHRANIYKDKTKYDRKDKSWRKDLD